MSIVEKDKELDSTLINILSPNQKPISLLAAMKKVEKACQNAIAKQTANPNLPTKPLAMSGMLLEISKNPKNEKDKPANVKVVDFILAKNTPDIMFNSLFLKLNSESISIDDLNQDFRERLMKGDQKDHKAFQQYLQKYSSGNTEIANSFSLINENIKKFSTKLTESFNTMISKNQDLQTENETETSSLKMKREIYADSRKLLLLSRKRLNEFNESIKYNLSNHYKTRAALHQEMMKFAGYLGTGKLGTFYRTLKPEQPLKIGEINSTNELAKKHETANIEANIYLLKLDNIICDLESKSKQLEEIQKMQAMIKRLAKKFSMYEANSHTLASHSYWHTTHIPKQVHTGIGHSSQPIEADLAGKPIIETIMEKGCILNKDNQLQKLESPEAVTQAIEKKQSIHLYDNVDNKGIYYGSLKTDGKGGIIGSNFNPRLANIASVDDPYFHEKIADWLRPALKSAIETAYQSDDKEVVIQCGKSKLGVQIYQIAVEIANAVIKEDDDITLVTDNNKIKKEINSLSEKFKLPSRSKLPSKSTYDYKPLIEELIAHKKQQIPNLFKDLEKELQEAQASRAKTSFKV